MLNRLLNPLTKVRGITHYSLIITREVSLLFPIFPPLKYHNHSQRI